MAVAARHVSFLSTVQMKAALTGDRLNGVQVVRVALAEDDGHWLRIVSSFLQFGTATRTAVESPPAHSMA